MKIIKKKEKRRVYCVSEYELDQCLQEPGRHPGIGILFAAVESGVLSVKQVSLDISAGIHGGYHKRKYSRDSFRKAFPAYAIFTDRVDVENLKPWEVELEDGSILTGNLGTAVSVLSTSEQTDYTRAVLEIEGETYRYHHYPEKLAADLMASEKWNCKRTVQALQKLEMHQDLYQEFVRMMEGNPLPADQIQVGKYTAEMLMRTVGLHRIGAYLMLAKLREDPETAEKRIRQGIVRK